MNENKRLEFHLGTLGKLIPLLVAVGFILWAAVSGSNVNGYMVAFFMAIIFGVIFAKDEKAYGQAIISGLTKPMFPIIALAVILAAISGKLISGSGMVQTIAAYAVQAGLTGKLFAAVTFLHRYIGGHLYGGHPHPVPRRRHDWSLPDLYDWRHCLRSGIWR